MQWWTGERLKTKHTSSYVVRGSYFVFQDIFRSLVGDCVLYAVWGRF